MKTKKESGMNNNHRLIIKQNVYLAITSYIAQYNVLYIQYMHCANGDLKGRSGYKQWIILWWHDASHWLEQYVLTENDRHNINRYNTNLFFKKIINERNNTTVFKHDTLSQTDFSFKSYWFSSGERGTRQTNMLACTAPKGLLKLNVFNLLHHKFIRVYIDFF